jgi:hypothetical protein
MKTLVLPKKYFEVERNEMEYIDGGWDIMSVRVAGAIFNAAISVATGGLTAKAYVSIYGGRHLVRTLSVKLAQWGALKLGTSLSLALDSALNYMDVGNAIARYLDSGDYCPNNGYLSI